MRSRCERVCRGSAEQTRPRRCRHGRTRARAARSEPGRVARARPRPLRGAAPQNAGTRRRPGAPRPGRPCPSRPRTWTARRLPWRGHQPMSRRLRRTRTARSSRAAGQPLGRPAPRAVSRPSAPAETTTSTASVLAYVATCGLAARSTSSPITPTSADSPMPVRRNVRDAQSTPSDPDSSRGRACSRHIGHHLARRSGQGDDDAAVGPVDPPAGRRTVRVMQGSGAVDEPRLLAIRIGHGCATAA